MTIIHQTFSFVKRDLKKTERKLKQCYCEADFAVLYAYGWSIHGCRDPTGQARPEEAGRRCCDSGEYAISGTGSAPLTSSHGAAEDAVDEIEDAHGTLSKQSLDLTDVLDTVHMASPFCWDTIFYHICGGKIVE